jgi:8-oxo-dGTP pyrophosphatase MutT (NUDIX family)
MPRNERWKPAVTVAAIVEQQGRYLLVEEHTPEGLMLNNPAGHLDPGESPLQAVVRETLEETARHFVPEALLGVYLARFVRPARAAAAPSSEGGEGSGLEDVTYLRLAFCGQVGEAIAGQALDTGIVRTLWLSLDELRGTVARHRSPLVLQCIEDHRAGRRLPLDAIHTHASIHAPLLKR